MKLETNLSPAESLALITEVITKTKENLRENSFCFLLWGWLITIASLGFFVLKQFTGNPLFFLPFPVTVIIGIIFTIRHFRHGTAIRTQTYAGFFLSRLWLVLGIGFLWVVLINVLNGKEPFTYTVLIAGIGTLVTGLVLRFQPMIAGGVLLLLCSVTFLYINPDYHVLLQAFAMIVSYLVPGYLLKFSKN